VPNKTLADGDNEPILDLANPNNEQMCPHMPIGFWDVPYIDAYGFVMPMSHILIYFILPF
jgi:hypothetical protein